MTSDAFAQLARPERKAPVATGHSERAHSKFSASGAERWFNCPGSVALSEGLPDKSSPWAIEGTQAHEVLEQILRAALDNGIEVVIEGINGTPATVQMMNHAIHAANIILRLHRSLPDSEAMVESRVYLDFIHPEMFGTFDGAVVDHFGTLHVFDYKYGAGHGVHPRENLQMIFYGIGLAHRYHWNFKRVRLWIIQPRIKGYDGPLFWEITTSELKRYVDLFQAAVERVLKFPDEYREGNWCHWCRAKSICPLKRAARMEEAKSLFTLIPIKN